MFDEKCKDVGSDSILSMIVNACLYNSHSRLLSLFIICFKQNKSCVLQYAKIMLLCIVKGHVTGVHICIIRPHRICVAYRCDLYLAIMVGLSVSESVVGHADVLWQNSWTNRDAVWHVGWDG